MPRGTYKFEVSGDGDLENSAVNVNLLRKLLLERKMIKGDELRTRRSRRLRSRRVACRLSRRRRLRRPQVPGWRPRVATDCA